MQDVDDRLRALDPFAGAPYEHADADAMVARVAAGRVPRRRSRRAAVMAPLAGVAAASLAVAGLLVTAGTAPTPDALTLLNGPTGPGSAGSALAFHGASPTSTTSVNGFSYPVVPKVSYEYEVGAPLSVAVPSEDAYEAVAPSKPRALLARWAAWLGVRGTVERTARGTSWRVGQGTTIATLRTSRASGLDEFTYASDAHRAGACSSRAYGTPVVSPAAFDGRLTGLLSALGLHYDLADPRLEATGTSCVRAVSVAEQLVVGGTLTDQSASAAYDASGRLVHASFPVFALGPATRYPLVSAAASADALVRSSDALDEAPGLKAEESWPTYRYWGPATFGTSDANQSAVVTRDLMTVELRTATLSLRAFETRGRGAWFVPVYELTGDGYSDLVRPDPITWSGTVLATSRAEVTLHGASAQSHVFDELPFQGEP